ncbi:MAG: FadR family transcriptional regulator [Chloroflexi bacterium]|nr:FadR family transcriptional regulator [Chloroflexota bacterium]
MRKPELSLFLQYLIHAYHEAQERGEDPTQGEVRLPPLEQISKKLGSSVPNLREQLAVARALGLVDAKPKVGIRLRPYSFTPAVSLSLRVAVALDRSYFDQFAELRKEVERAFFRRAAQALTDEDRRHLEELIQRAWEKLNDRPPRIPHREHRDLHLTLYCRLQNTFVKGIIEAFWDIYEAVGLNRYADIAFLREVWKYHQRIVEYIIAEDYDQAQKWFEEHLDMLKQREPQTEHLLSPEPFWEEEE